MIQKYLLILISICCLIMSCQNEKAIERKLLGDEVNMIHDEMMEEISGIRKGKKELETLIKSANAAKDSTNQLIYEKAYYHLNHADDVMFGWMNQFVDLNPENSVEPVPHDKAIEILKDQKQKVIKMKEVMILDMEEARKVIEF